MKRAKLIFPHQLFEETPLEVSEGPVYVVEEFLYFRQFPFHKQKIAFQRSSMKAYCRFLETSGQDVHYIESNDKRSDVRELIENISKKDIQEVEFIDPTDCWLEKRIIDSCQKLGLETIIHDNPGFLNTRSDLKTFFRSDKKKFHQTKFYINERKRRGILLENPDSPEGGKWTYDTDNRKKYPRGNSPPEIVYPGADKYSKEAAAYTEEHFSDNPGSLSEYPLYPNTHAGSIEWFEAFLESRFKEFGPYEDAIVEGNDILHHSVLSPLLNTGLLTPSEVIDRAISYASDNEIPLNSVEGFVRQILGWREFIRGIYESKGGYQRTKNFWGFKRKIPASFYDASTGIVPVDCTIEKVLRTGYCHHIERLMILGNFMLLCEFDPDEVYRWFMELFVDAYDWVMVPNVYGMSQFADGGLMSTKPYISGSNYVLKMSDYEKGEWTAVWDGLFWRFMDVNRSFFEGNARLGMLVGNLDRMSAEKRASHFETAEGFLEDLDG